jgi:hypothetical protein
MSLQARRAATGGITPDQTDNVHGVSAWRVLDPDAAAPVTRTEEVWNKTRNADKTAIDRVALKKQLRWRRASITVVTKNGAEHDLDVPELHRAVITAVADMDKVSTSTASKFHSHELEREAVRRAIDKVQNECVWGEILEVEGGKEVWRPLNSVTVTVYVGRPERSAGWGMSVRNKSDDKLALDQANIVIERYRKGSIKTEAELLTALDLLMDTVKEEVKGRKTESVSMTKSARVTLVRSANGWTSITHFADVDATPAGGSIRGRFVRVSAKVPAKVTVPAGKLP